MKRTPCRAGMTAQEAMLLDAELQQQFKDEKIMALRENPRKVKNHSKCLDKAHNKKRLTQREKT